MYVTSTAPVAGRVVRTGPVDRHHSLRRSAFVVGPLPVPSAEVAATRLRAMAAAGPHTRIGLRPDPTSSRWIYDPAEPAISVVDTDDPGDDPLRLLDVVRTDDDAAFRVAVSGEHMAIDFNHGLGDAGLLLTAGDVILGVLDPTDPATWRPYRRRVPALSVAAARVGADPRRVLALARLMRRAAATDHPDLPDPVPSGPPTTRPSAIGVHVGAATLAAVRAARTATLPGVSVFALTTIALVNVLTTAGIELNPFVTTPFDARGYLPRSRGTLGNFSAGLVFAVRPGTEPAALQHQISRSARTGRPVANLVVTSAKARLFTEPEPQAAASAHGIDLLHSSVGHLPGSNDRWTWIDERRARVFAAPDPPHTNGLTATSALVGGGMSIALAYYPNMIARESLSQAVSRLDDELRTLTRLA